MSFTCSSCSFAGFHAGTDVSGPVPGKFPHDLESGPPEVSEKPGKGAEERLNTEGNVDLLHKANSCECTQSPAGPTPDSREQEQVPNLQTLLPSPAFPVAVSSYRRADAQISVRMVDQ